MPEPSLEPPERKLMECRHCGAETPVDVIDDDGWCDECRLARVVFDAMEGWVEQYAGGRDTPCLEDLRFLLEDLRDKMRDEWPERRKP